jgi:hypothetical protein
MSKRDLPKPAKYIFISSPKENSRWAQAAAAVVLTGPLVELTRHGHSVWSRLCDFPDERHVSHFESRSFDRNGHLNVLIHALE